MNFHFDQFESKGVLHFFGNLEDDDSFDLKRVVLTCYNNSNYKLEIDMENVLTVSDNCLRELLLIYELHKEEDVIIEIKGKWMNRDERV